jgi:hypothetical protein
MTRTLRYIGITVVYCIGYSIEAAPLIVHQGLIDPVSEGWTLQSSGTTAGILVGGAETTASGSHDYWQIQDLSFTGTRYYEYQLTPEISMVDWRLEASLRIIDSPIVSNSTDVGGTGILVGDGLNYWSFYLSNTTVGPISDTGKTGLHSLLLSSPVDTQSDYHNYVIEFSHNGTGPADDTADFFIDGVLVFDDVGRSGLWTETSNLVWFGPIATNGTSDAHFELVSFTPVPIPAAAWLFGSGLLGLIGISRRKKAA